MFRDGDDVVDVCPAGSYKPLRLMTVQMMRITGVSRQFVIWENTAKVFAILNESCSRRWRGRDAGTTQTGLEPEMVAELPDVYRNLTPSSFVFKTHQNRCHRLARVRDVNKILFRLLVQYDKV